MPGPPNKPRPPLVVGIEWVSQITTVCLEMVLPAWGGHWLDGKWGTSPWLVIIGVVLGFTVGMWHLLALVKPRSGDRSSRAGDPK